MGSRAFDAKALSSSGDLNLTWVGWGREFEPEVSSLHHSFFLSGGIHVVLDPWMSSKGKGGVCEQFSHQEGSPQTLQYFPRL